MVIFCHVRALLPILLFTLSAVNGQETGHRIAGISTDTLQQNIASVMFDKSLNTYHWTGMTFYKDSAGPLFVQINEQYFSTLIRTDKKLITDNQNIDLRIRYRMSDKFSVVSNFSSFILSDNKSMGGSISKAGSHGMYGGLAYQPVDPLIIEPLIGIRFDKQLDRQDNGPSLLLGVASDRIDYAGYAARVHGTFQYDKIDPRILETYNASLQLDKTFFEQTRNFLRLSYFRNRRDFYSPVDSALNNLYGISNNIESRADNIFTISDSLNYNIGNSWFWTFQGNIYTREITRTTRYHHALEQGTFFPNTTINELKIDGGVHARYILNERFNISLAFAYQERDEKHHAVSDIPSSSLIRMEEKKNNHARRTGIVSSTTWVVSSSDTVALSGSANIIRYDTPSEANDDDRDELWYLLNLTTHHRFNQHLLLNISADLNLAHLVYLFSARSADNNWNRIIRFSPSVEYSPFADFRTTNRFEVLANYTVYDFEYLSAQTRSFAFRQFAFIDSTSLALTNRLGIDWFSYIRLYERGEFSWNSFAERPVNYFEDKTFGGSLRYLLNNGLLFSLGIRYFSQLRYGYDGRKRTLNSYLKSVGPTAGLYININKTSLSVNGWYERQTQTNQPDRGFTTMVLSLNVRI